RRPQRHRGRPVQGGGQRRGQDPGQPDLQAQGRQAGAHRPGDPQDHGLVDPGAVSDLARPQREELAPSAGSSANAVDGTGATATGEDRQPPVRPLTPDAATGWAVVVFVIAQAIGAAVVLIWYSGGVPTSPTPAIYEGRLVALVTLVTNPALVGLF